MDLELYFVVYIFYNPFISGLSAENAKIGKGNIYSINRKDIPQFCKPPLSKFIFLQEESTH
jgi:hypothetical protein